MGSVPRNKKVDNRTLTLLGFDAPAHEKGASNVDMTFKTSRADGYPVWTENKSKLIGKYVQYFTYVTKHGAYIDGFAGPQVEHYNDEAWSAKKVLENEPPRMRRFFLCDIDPGQVKFLRSLKDERQSKDDHRHIEIFQGDFNETVDQILTPENIREKEATFCLLDQRTFECKWRTVEKIAQFKEMKIEQFYFLPVGWLGRSISALKDDQILVDWWGRKDVSILKDTSDSFSFTKLFQKRFQELGYKYVSYWPIHERKDGGRVMYYMIHSSDHPEAPKLMNRAYKNATLFNEPLDHLQNEFDFSSEFEVPEDGAEQSQLR